MKRHTFLLVIVCILATGFLAACTRTQPLVQPSFEVATTNKDRVAQAIKQALVGRGWAVTSTKSNRIEATYRRAGGATADIAVEHAGNRITIKHRGSQDLLYSDAGGAPVIHRTYNNWVTNLERDIQVFVGSTL